MNTRRLRMSLAAAMLLAASAAADVAEDALRLTGAVCQALTHGDAAPLVAMALNAGLARDAQAHLESLRAVANPDAAARPPVTETECGRHLRSWADRLKDTRCFIVRGPGEGDSVAVTARFDADERSALWRFRFGHGESGFGLQQIEMPLEGTDLAQWTAEEIFFAEASPAPETPQPRRTLSPGLIRVAIVGLVIVIGAFLFRSVRRRTGEEGSLLHNRGFLGMALLILLVAALAAVRRLYPPPAPPSGNAVVSSAAEMQALHRSMKSGLHRAAQQSAERLLAAHPNATWARVALVQALILSKQFDEAAKPLRALQSEPRLQPFCDHAWARIAEQTDRPQEAAAHLLALRKALGDDDELLARLARAFYKSENLDEAERAVARALKQNPLNAEALLLRARMAVKRGDLDAAAGDLRTVRAHYIVHARRLAQDDDFSALKSRKEYADIFRQN